MFCGVFVSQSLSGFQALVNEKRPSFTSAAVNGSLVKSLTFWALSWTWASRR